MLKIHFLTNPKIPNDKVDEWKDYKKDTVHEVSSDEANRWIRRGVAEIVTTRQTNLIVAELKEEEKEPEPKPVEVSETVVNSGSVSTQASAPSSSSSSRSSSSTAPRLVPRQS